MYIDLVSLYLLFDRSGTTNDLKLFTICLGKLCAIYFVASFPNYAEWMTRYDLDILYIDEAHAAACEMLETG